MLLQKIKRSVIGIIVLVALLGAVTLWAVSRSVRVASEPPALSALQPQKFAVTAAPDNIHLISERPLFWADRTPYEAPVESAPEPVTKKTNTALDKAQVMGVFAAGGTSSVILKVKDKVQRIGINEMYEGWRLTEVSSDDAVFLMEQGGSSSQPAVKTIKINSREPLPAQWQGEQHNYSESK
jgi:hypothetical protein